MKIDFYYVKNDYIEFLKNFEIQHRGFTCVPNTQYTLSKKFLYGTVLNKNGINYFVPVSSKIKGDVNTMIIKIGNDKRKKKAVSSLRFAYMIPIPQSCLVHISINEDITDYRRKQLMREELAFCRRETSKITKQAERTYEAVSATKKGN